MARNDCWCWVDFGESRKPPTRWEKFVEGVKFWSAIFGILGAIVSIGVGIGYLIWG